VAGPDVEPSRVFLVRHGTTEWSLSGRHTGRTDLPLTAQGEADARAVGHRLRSVSFDAVWTSPRRRARQTCELAGLGGSAAVVEELAEWDYGAYEGLTTAQILERDPDWTVWSGGGPGGESPAQVSERADRVVRALPEGAGTVAVFSHGHFLRALAVRWIGLDIGWGRALALDTGSISVISFERRARVITSWNESPDRP